MNTELPKDWFVIMVKLGSDEKPVMVEDYANFEDACKALIT